MTSRTWRNAILAVTCIVLLLMLLKKKTYYGDDFYDGTWNAPYYGYHADEVDFEDFWDSEDLENSPWHPHVDRRLHTFDRHTYRDRVRDRVRHHLRDQLRDHYRNPNTWRYGRFNNRKQELVRL